jgi:(p)ppGpp synthase/HD superfamily hydrolase
VKNGHAIRELAKAWATVAHDGVSRKGAGEPYFNHVERVANSVWGWRRKSIAYLHDVVEDAEHPDEMEKALCAIFPIDIVNDVMRLSRMPDEDGKKQGYMEWIEMIAASGNLDVIAVKLADIEDNLHDITDIPGMEGMQIRYMNARATLKEAL